MLRAERARWRCAAVGGLKEESRMKRDFGGGKLVEEVGIVLMTLKVEGEVMNWARDLERAARGGWMADDAILSLMYKEIVLIEV